MKKVSISGDINNYIHQGPLKGLLTENFIHSVCQGDNTFKKLGYIWGQMEKMLPKCLAPALVGESSYIGATSLGNFVLSISENIYFLFENFIRYPSAFSEIMEIRSFRGRNMAYLELISNFHLEDNAKKAVFYNCIYGFSKLLSNLKQITEFEVLPHVLHFQYEGDEFEPLVRSHFQCKNLYFQEKNFMAFDNQVLLLKNKKFNQNFSEEVKFLVNSQINTLDKAGSIFTHIVNSLIKNFNFGFPTLEKLASLFSTNSRYMSKKLREEGTTFREALKKATLNMYFYFKENSSFSKEEISFIMGYSDTEEFYETMKRWTGNNW